MSKILTNNQYYYQIADAIREQNGTSNTYKPAQMVSALKDLFYEEVEGVPPLNFQGIGEDLLDYRIDGASGGVGNRTSNLFDYKTWKNGITGISNSGNIIFNNDNSFTITANNVNDVYTLGYSNYKVPVKAETDYYFNFSSNNTNAGLIYIFENGTNDNEHKHIAFNQTGKYVSFTTQSDTTYIIIRFGVYAANTEITYKNISLVEGNSAPSNYEPYGYKVPVVISGKNLFDEIYPNIVINTVKYISFALTNGEYTLSSNIPNGGSASLFLLAGQVNSGASTQNNGVWLNNPQTVNVIDGFLTIGYRIYGNMNPEDYETILALGSTATDYEPYHEPTITNIYLNTPIEANESISLSDTNTNIPTIRGTNVLTVDTTVQPSNVYIKSRHESSYETAMREDYEEQLSDIESALQEV